MGSGKGASRIKHTAHLIGNACYGWVKDKQGITRECDNVEESGVCSKCGEHKPDMRGSIIYNGEYFITIEGRNYRECFLKTDIKGDRLRIYINGKGITYGRNTKREPAQLGFTQ